MRRLSLLHLLLFTLLFIAGASSVISARQESSNSLLVSTLRSDIVAQSNQAGALTAGAIVDIAAIIAPGIPGGAGLAIKAARYGEKAMDVVNTATTAVGVGQSLSEGDYGGAALAAATGGIGTPGRRKKSHQEHKGMVASNMRGTPDPNIKNKGSDGLPETSRDIAAKKIAIDKSKYPEAAKHLEDAGAVGKPLTVDRAGAAARRKAAMKGTQTQPGMDRDEAPPAVFQEGSQSVRSIPRGDNRGAGGSLGQQLKRVKDGEKVVIDTKPND